jgi:hypothetical protein
MDETLSSLDRAFGTEPAEPRVKVELIPHCDCREVHVAAGCRVPRRAEPGNGLELRPTLLRPGTKDVCKYCGYTVCFRQLAGWKPRNVQGNKKLVKRGVDQHLAKLNEESVREIRRLHSTGVTIGRVARQYGVSRTVVSDVVNKKSWRHVV